ncbi:membrane protein A22A [Aotine betaherpesvirus 1]|uniref:Membrane protein A22A n=1 Tax=Aotine betaherpesvirus 1 TaxID=50290 RepID=G8XUI7_9BETA|nr:membrane protein A22A [Aotine betaherpesvirus 1]AEV80828.1 membrane protein A22A [Aotine betaherpesvirus 1]
MAGILFSVFIIQLSTALCATHGHGTPLVWSKLFSKNNQSPTLVKADGSVKTLDARFDSQQPVIQVGWAYCTFGLETRCVDLWSVREEEGYRAHLAIFWLLGLPARQRICQALLTRLRNTTGNFVRNQNQRLTASLSLNASSSAPHQKTVTGNVRLQLPTNSRSAGRYYAYVVLGNDALDRGGLSSTYVVVKDFILLARVELDFHCYIDGMFSHYTHVNGTLQPCHLVVFSVITACDGDGKTFTWDSPTYGGEKNFTFVDLNVTVVAKRHKRDLVFGLDITHPKGQVMLVEYNFYCNQHLLASQKLMCRPPDRERCQRNADWREIPGHLSTSLRPKRRQATSALEPWLWKWMVVFVLIYLYV